MPTREQQKRWNDRYYAKNKAKYRARNHRYRARNKKYMKDYLATHPCVDCGNTDVRVLDFDHVRGEKNNNVTTLAHTAGSLTRVIAEIDKCDVRCANCHRIATHERRGSSTGRASGSEPEG